MRRANGTAGWLAGITLFWVMTAVVRSQEAGSAVFTEDYQARALEERPWHEVRFVQALRWPGARPQAGLQFEQKDFLLKGDQLSLRSTRLQWHWGEPTRELQWQFNAALDRRAASQRGALNLQVLRRF